MSELRRDPVTGRWVIIEAAQTNGPDRYERERPVTQGGPCPFCPGNEAMTPPEIHAVRPNGGAPNSPGWTLRVIPNKFPALRDEGQLDRRGLGLFDACNGVGVHEVVIETPDHRREIADLGASELAEVIRAVQQRFHALTADERWRSLLLFKNVGLTAGASLEHPHTQLIALPIVPKRVQEELRGAERYFDFRERCVFCDMLSQEQQEGERVVAENGAFLAYCPFVSRFPFETWILPRQHQADVFRLSPQDVDAFAQVLQETLQRLRGVLSDPPYNLLVHTAPRTTHERDAYHWHVEILPALTRVAGFEWGTGFYINPTAPEHAARWLRGAARPGSGARG